MGAGDLFNDGYREPRRRGEVGRASLAKNPTTATKKLEELTKTAATPDEKTRKAAEAAVADASAELHAATLAVEQARFASW